MLDLRAGEAPVLLCGYYGEHNLGDDALLEVLLEQLPAGCRAVVTAHDGESVRRRFAVETVDRRSPRAVLQVLGRCRALVLGGGSLLQDATSFSSLVYYAALIVAARARGLPVLLWAQGLGPLRRRRSRLLVRLLLPLVSAASWRDPASAALARRLGGKVSPVGSDPVWGLAPRAWAGLGGPIVLCWRPVAGWGAGDWRPYLQALESLVEETGREVIWLPFHAEQDTELLQELRHRGVLGEAVAARSRIERPGSPEGALDLLGSASLVLAMRLHGLILAAVAGSPCAALSYDPKVEAAAAALGCPCHRLSQPVDATLLQQWRRVFERPAPADRVERLRQEAGRHREVLACLASGD